MVQKRLSEAAGKKRLRAGRMLQRAKALRRGGAGRGRSARPCTRGRRCFDEGGIDALRAVPELADQRA